MSDVNPKHQDLPNWSTGQFALEVQQPWSRLLLDRKKTVEARAYPLPKALLGRRICLLESSERDSTQSGLLDRFQTNAIVGFVVFSEVRVYNSQEEFRSEEASHLVPETSPFGWREGTDRLYGWKVQSVESVVAEQDTVWVERRMRSLFEIMQ